jgi:hypothetical protein
MCDDISLPKRSNPIPELSDAILVMSNASKYMERRSSLKESWKNAIKCFEVVHENLDYYTDVTMDLEDIDDARDNLMDGPKDMSYVITDVINTLNTFSPRQAYLLSSSGQFHYDYMDVLHNALHAVQRYVNQMVSDISMPTVNVS